LTISAAQSTTLSSLSDELFLAGMVILFVGLLSLLFVRDVRYARRVYWLSWASAGSVMSLAVVDRGLPSVCLAAVAAMGFASLYAYFRTSYIKFGGRVFAFTIPDSRPDPPRDGSAPLLPPAPLDSYRSLITAPKLWWTLAVVTFAAAYAGFELDISGATLGLTAFVTVIFSLIGHWDAREHFPIARRQFIQLSLIVVASIPIFLIPPVAYFATYWAAGGSFKMSRNSDISVD
jgi:hypothetical protein